MLIFIFAVVTVFAFMLLMKILWTKSKPKLSTSMIMITSVVFVGSLVVLIATGRVHWIAATGTAILPFLRRGFSLLRYAPIAARMWQTVGRGSPFTGSFGGMASSSTDSAPNVSEATTEDIRMTLEHASGEMSGSVLVGKYANRMLESLNETEIVELYNSVGNESKRLLTAYIQRYHPNLGSSEPDAENQANVDHSDSITPDRARRILGVGEEATREEIIDAHRRLMQKNHPDRGGSEYIASEINQAKQVLLDLL